MADDPKKPITPTDARLLALDPLAGIKQAIAKNPALAKLGQPFPDGVSADLVRSLSEVQFATVAGVAEGVRQERKREQNEQIRQAADSAFDQVVAAHPTDQAERPAEKPTVSDHAADSLTGKVLDYVGMGFLLSPPEVLILELVVGSGPINWTLVIAATAGCYAVGIFMLALGLNWKKVKPKLSESLANNITWAANSVWVWLVLLAIIAFGPPLLVIVLSKTGPVSAEAIVQKLPAPPAGMFNEALPKAPMPPRSKQTINELLGESGKMFDVATKIGHELYEDMQSLSRQNPEAVCLNLNIDDLRQRISFLKTRFRDAQGEITTVYDNNRIDVPEFDSVFPNKNSQGFEAAAKGLEQYWQNISVLANRKPCEEMIRSNLVPGTIIRLDEHVRQFAAWLAETENNFRNYRNSLRTELRNSP